MNALRFSAKIHSIHKNWLVTILATIGRMGRRDIFGRNTPQLLESEDVPVSLRVSWNQQMERITTALGQVRKGGLIFQRL